MKSLTQKTKLLLGFLATPADLILNQLFPFMFSYLLKAFAVKSYHLIPEITPYQSTPIPLLFSLNPPPSSIDRTPPAPIRHYHPRKSAPNQLWGYLPQFA